MPTPRAQTSRISAEIDPSTLAKLEEKSRQDGSTVAALVRRIVEKYFEADRRELKSRAGVSAREKQSELPDVTAIRGLLGAKARAPISLEGMDEAMGRLLAEDDMRIRRQAAG